MRGLLDGQRSQMRRNQYAPWLFSTRRILLPVTKRTWGIPCESRRVTPIWDGVRPLRASLMMCSTTSSGVVLSHDGGVRRYGRAEEAEEGSASNQRMSGNDAHIPFPGACIRPMVALKTSQRRRGRRAR